MTRERFNETTLKVCEVCIHLMSNGEYNDGTDAAETASAGMERIWGADAINLIADGENLGHSTSSCDGCGNTDHDDRFKATALIPIPETVTTWADGFGRWHARVAYSGDLTAQTAQLRTKARRAIRRTLTERGSIGPGWRCRITVTKHDTESITFREI